MKKLSLEIAAANYIEDVLLYDVGETAIILMEYFLGKNGDNQDDHLREICRAIDGGIDEFRDELHATICAMLERGRRELHEIQGALPQRPQRTLYAVMQGGEYLHADNYSITPRFERARIFRTRASADRTIAEHVDRFNGAARVVEITAEIACYDETEED